MFHGNGNERRIFSSHLSPLKLFKYYFSSLGQADVVDKASEKKFQGVLPRKTTVLLLHHGQPRTLFYAKNFLTRSARDFYKLPIGLTSFFMGLGWPLSGKLQSCVADYSRMEVLSSTIERISRLLESAVNELIPEFGLLHCTFAFLYDEPSVEQTLNSIIREGMDRLIVLPLYPHYSCFRTGTMLNSVVKAVCEQTVPLVSDGRVVENIRVVPMSHVSFALSVIDRWSSHPVVPNLWYQQIRNKIGEYDNVLFVAPHQRGYNAKEYTREVWASCERLMECLGNVLPWHIAWYGAWDQWPATTTENITTQLYFLRREREGRTLVIPITALFPTFDTETVLPNILVDKGVELALPSSASPVLVHGLTELIKNHLLGRACSAQLSRRCSLCLNTQCEDMRRLLFPKKVRRHPYASGNAKAVLFQKKEINTALPGNGSLKQGMPFSSHVS